MGTQALTTSPTVDTEILRVYEVTIERTDITDDDGSPIAYPVRVALRYPHKRAEARPAGGYDARAEAARRACKVERREHTIGDDVMLFADPENVKLVRQRIVEGRAK